MTSLTPSPSINIKKQLVCVLITVFILPFSSFSAESALAQMKQKKPAWLDELSLQVKESYESNTYLQQDDPNANEATAVTTITPTISVSSKILGDVTSLKFTYSPEIAIYHAEPSEDYTTHNITTLITSKNNNYSWNINNKFVYNDGNAYAPTYTGPGGAPAVAHYQVRDRRDAIRDFGDYWLRYDKDDWFFRLRSELELYDFRTHQLDTAVRPGYQNYVDRTDINGGLDIGYKAFANTYLYMGYRLGRQIQPTLLASPNHASNTYNRFLFGIEGKPFSWLTLNFEAGPDFRDYDDMVRAGWDTDPVTLYLKTSATAQITAKDAFTLYMKHYERLSSGGGVSYSDVRYKATYKHTFTDKFATTLGFQYYLADTCPPVISEDWIYSYSALAEYKLDANWTLFADYLFESAESQIAGASGKEYNRHVASLGFKYFF